MLKKISDYLGVKIHVQIVDEPLEDEAKGQSVSRNQSLPWDLLTDYCRSVRITIKKKSEINFSQIIQEYLEKSEQKGQEIARPPIVSIMGHIDHGKTTLLDTIRQTQVQKKEAGGITQKVTVSQCQFHGQKITFLDTPGHSDFIKMRQRGISLTDLVILVIDAKDGVMSQTSEIIDYLHQYNLPIIVFINHKKPAETDNETNLNRIRTQLQEKGLTPLEWGGEIIMISGNAREQDSTRHLMENILFFADFKANLSRPAQGVVIDSYLHPQTGSQINELLVQDGELKEKDIIFLNGKFSKVKMMLGIDGKKTTAVGPSDISRVIGVNIQAELGDRFLVINNEKIIAVLTADSQNSLEALIELIKKQTTSDFNFSIIYATVGNLNNFALDLTKVTNSTVLTFGLLSPIQIKTLKENNIPFFSSKIIYEISEKLDEIISIVSGKISRNKRVYVLQGKEEKKVFVGEIKSLESKNESKAEVISGQECGIVLKGFDKFQEGDKIVAFHRYEREISHILYKMIQEYNLPSFSLSYCEISARGENVKIYLSFAQEGNHEKLLNLLNKEYLQLIKKEIVRSLSIALFTEIFVRYLASRPSSRKMIFNNFFIDVTYSLIRLPYHFLRPIVKPRKKIFVNSEKDIIRFINNLTTDNILEKSEAKLVQSAFNFDELKVIGFKDDMSYSEIQNIHSQHFFTRYPVFNKKKEIIGIFNMEVFYWRLIKNKKARWQDYIDKKIVCFSPNDKLDTVLAKLQASNCRLAIIQEKKRLSGIITLQDVLSTLVGKIRDEREILLLPRRLD
ncbi:6743_t:CDS:2 [Entrophospora sp. SA101]|nr:6743_t:CDS:2 [Entrophospora sp. SA101]